MTAENALLRHTAISWVDRRHTEAEAYETALPEGFVEDGTDYARSRPMAPIRTILGH